MHRFTSLARGAIDRIAGRAFHALSDNHRPRVRQGVDQPGNPARPMLPDEATATKLAVDVVNKIVKAAVAKAGK